MKKKKQQKSKNIAKKNMKQKINEKKGYKKLASNQIKQSFL